LAGRGWRRLADVEEQNYIYNIMRDRGCLSVRLAALRSGRVRSERGIFRSDERVALLIGYYKTGFDKTCLMNYVRHSHIYSYLIDWLSLLLYYYQDILFIYNPNSTRSMGSLNIKLPSGIPYRNSVYEWPLKMTAMG
jgi:hypothetical protein